MPSTPATNAIGVELQAAGENLNTWGANRLNNGEQVLANMRVKWNALTINSGATTTISETNYATTNDTEVGAIDLIAGTIAAAFSLVLPGRSKIIPIRNSTGYACTIKLSATTGFTLPTGRIALVATDGSTDVVNFTPNFGGKATPTSGTLDIPAWSAVETAIAAAGLPATAGTILVSGTDTTAGYGGTKITVAGSGAASVVATTTSPGGNEIKVWTVSVGAFGLTPGAAQTTSFVAVVNTRYTLAKTGNMTITMPAAPAVGDVVWVEVSGTAGLVTWGLNSLKAYGSTTNPTSTSEGIQAWSYSGASRGWIDL